LQVLPRTFVQFELDDLVLNYNSKLDFYINIGDIDSVSELVSGVLSNLNYEATHSGNDSSVYELYTKVRSVLTPNGNLLVRLGDLPGEIDRTMVGIRAKIRIARPSEPDVPPKRTKNGTITNLRYPNSAQVTMISGVCLTRHFIR